MSLDYPILPICQTAESFRNILSAMGPYRDSISLKKSPLLGLYTGSEAQLDLATVRYHALGAYAKSVYLVFRAKCRAEILDCPTHKMFKKTLTERAKQKEEEGKQGVEGDRGGGEQEVVAEA